MTEVEHLIAKLGDAGMRKEHAEGWVNEILAEVWKKGFDDGQDQEAFNSRGTSWDSDAHTFPRTNPYESAPIVERPECSMGDERPEGWEFLVLDSGGQVMAGWTDEGVFHQWEPTATIVRNLADALIEAVRPQ